MNNTQISEILQQLARLTEYREGRSYLADELFQLSEQVDYLDVPLEVFNENVPTQKDERELDQMINYWFGNHSSEALRNLREIILTGTSGFRDHILAEISPAAVEMLKLRTLPSQLVDMLRKRLNIKNVSTLKKACGDRFLSQAGIFSEQDELDILEEIVSLEESSKGVKEQATRQSVLDSIEDGAPLPDDSDLVFLANADALAEFILLELREPFRPSIKQTVSELATSETLNTVKEQARGVLGKVKRFFISKDDPRYAQIRFEEEERAREASFKRVSSEIDASFTAASNQPLQIEKVGSVRRGEDSITRLDFLVRTNEPEIAFERVKKSAFVKDVLIEDKFYLVVSLRSDSFVMPYNNRPTPELKLYFYVASDFVYGTYEVLLTSTKGHWDELKRRASLRGFKLFPLGLYEGTSRVSSRTVERLYERLGLPLIQDELREDQVEWRWIDDGMPRLVELSDLRGDMHMHTTFTDGTGDVETMVSVARSMDLSYIALTDHTKNVASVGGMNDAEFLRYWDHIDDYNQTLTSKGVPFRALKGAEVDILEEGGLDLEDETLAHADWVIASIHFGKNQSQSKIHRRYMDAFTNPYVDVIAHPTGRMIGTEEPIEVDIEFLCENAKKYGKYLELNCQPRRLDLNVKALTIAKKYGVPIVVSTDAHTPDQMAYLRFGVQQAYRAGLTCDDVLNTLPVEEVLKRRRNVKQKFGIYKNLF